MKRIFNLDLNSYPLARRFVLIVMLSSLVFTLLLAAGQVFFDYRREIDQINTELQRILNVDVPGLSNSLWNFDRKQIATQLQGMLNIQDVRYIELLAEGDQAYQVGQPVPAANALSRTYALEHNQNGQNLTIGQLVVTADTRGPLVRVLDRLLGVLVTSAIQIFLLAGFILLVVERLLTRPLREIVSYTETLDLEHLEAPLVFRQRRLASRGDELELVAQKLNEMRQRLLEDVAERKRMEQALRESERNYREIFNATSEAIFIHAIDGGRILQVNASMLRMYGYDSEEEVLGSPVSNLSSDQEPYTQRQAEYFLQETHQSGPQIFEWLARKKNGETFWTEVSLRNSLIGGENRILAVVRDITERKRAENLLRAQNEALVEQGRALEKAEAETRQLNTELEKRVRERTTQLAALNQELESFSYSVAHDLRTPLRHMNSFSQIILEEHGGELNDEVRQWLGRIQESTQNLSQMVEALMALSRVTRDELNYSRVDLSALVQGISAELQQHEAGRPAEFVIAPGLTATADYHLLRILLENLLGNAWKFSTHSQPARIEFGQAPVEGEQRCFFVRDNGAGFDMDYANRLFIPFQRLHSAAAFPGTGIGLATVKRIVQRHGGRVWAEGAVGAGATFYFTLD